MAKKITPYFILFGIVAVVVYDVYAFIQGGQEATISHLIVTDWIYNYPAFTYASGFVCGHLFWPMARKKYKGRENGDISAS